MPYFIYRITPSKKLTRLDEREQYRDAREVARDLRSKQPKDDDDLIKMIFAKSAPEAEQLLLVEREPRPMGEELG